MRIILFFDLPMEEKEEIKAYNNFKKTLRKLGFYQMQYSIYVKVVPTESSYKTVLRNLQNNIPTRGHIRIMKITEKQYKSMIILQGSKNSHELIISDKELVIFMEGEDELLRD